MWHKNSAFHTVLKHVPWHVPDRLVDAHEAAARVRRLSTQDQFIALLCVQLSGACATLKPASPAMHAVRLLHPQPHIFGPVAEDSLRHAGARAHHDERGVLSASGREPGPHLHHT
jgi:hypothetical protein